MKQGFLLASVALIAASSSPLCAQDSGGAPVSSDADIRASNEPGEIIVTAQRRSERLQDVPVAVTALTSQALENRGIASMVDVMGSVPNLHASNNIGQGSATTVFIRGVGETESIISVDTPSGFYLDDVFIARQGVNNMGLFDIERIEVLRGPQGTLYGRNTSAGALKVVSVRPQFDALGATLEGSYGRFKAWSAKASINVPLSDKAAVRANAIISGGNDYMQNAFNGEGINGTKTKGARLALRLAPTDALEINISGDYARSSQRGTYTVDIAGINRPSTGSIYIANSGEDTRNIAKAGGVNGTVEWAISDNATIKSITAWRQTQQAYNLDLSDQPVPLYVLYTKNNSKQFTQELQLSGTALGDRLSYVTGLYYFHEKSKAYIGDLLFQSTYLNKDIGVDTKSYAAFAQFNVKVVEGVSIIAGGRYTKDDKSITFEQRIGGTPGFTPGGIVLFDTDDLNGRISPARPGRPVATDLKFKKFTPKFGIELKPSRDMLFYATYTQGFKSGGWSARVTAADEFFDFDPETINSYEVGVKSTLFNGAGTFNVTGFYYDYTNLFTTGTTDTGSFGVATSDAEIYGIEVETNWRLARGISAYANGAWQNGTRKSVSASTLALGSEFQRAPKYSATIGTNIRRPITDTIDFMVNGQYSYTGKHYVNPQNTFFGLVPAVELVDASIGISANNDSYQLTLGCKNCFGEKYITQILDLGAVPGFNFTSVYAGPRAAWTITGKVKY